MAAIEPDIYAGGWRLRTGLPLPATLPWPDADRGAPDLIFAPGAVPGALADPAIDRDFLQIAADGTALVRFDDIGRFLIRDGVVTYDLAVAEDAPELTPILFGNILACICWRRGQLALHGSAVAIGGRAVMLLGRVATGKSLLAAALARRGHCLLADEVVVAAGAMCFPTGGPLQLADDALLAAGIDPSPLPRYDNFPIPKRHWSAGPAPEPRPYPVAAMICLSKALPDAPVDPRPLASDEAAAAILNHFYWRDMLDLLDSRSSAEREAAALVDAATVFDLAVPRDLARVDEIASAIERLA